MEREPEIREVLENFKNLERECSAAQQSVASDVRDKVQRLQELWAQVRSNAAPERASGEYRVACILMLVRSVLTTTDNTR